MSFTKKDLPINVDAIKGFLADDEGEALFAAAAKSVTLGPVSYTHLTLPTILLV